MFNVAHTLSATSSAIPLVAGQPSLIPVSISGTEAVNTLFSYRVVMATPDNQNYRTYQAANFNLDDFIGHEMTMLIQLVGNGTFIPGMQGHTGMGNVGAGVREISGLISDARFLREEGRHALYEMTIRPWLHVATLRTNCKLFQDQTVVEVLDILLGDYLFPVEKRLYDDGRYPKRDMQNQYNESDFTFFSRLCEEWGISYWFEHSDGAHRLVLGDTNMSFRTAPSEAYHTLQFHTEGKRIDEETIHAFTLGKKLVSGIYTMRDYDYTRPKADLTLTSQELHPTAQNNLEQYAYHTDTNYSQPNAGAQPFANDTFGEGKWLALMRMQSNGNQAQRGIGAGHVRGLPAGCTFMLKGHPQASANVEYIVVSTTLAIEEVSSETQRTDGGQQYRVDCNFEVHPMQGQEYRPERITPSPIVHTATALVVGPRSQPVWTDALGRIKLQFHWDRLGQNDQNSSLWVRNSEMWSGNQLGSTHIPRIGSEVIVSFIGGDIDQPIVTGFVNNQNNLPPWALPNQQALSGIRSREFGDSGGNSAMGRSNHFAMDDTLGKMQINIKSDELHSLIALGHNKRLQSNAGNQEDRGRGLEARTDGHAAFRSALGLLLTTYARLGASGNAMSVEEINNVLLTAFALTDQMATNATTAKAQNNEQKEIAKDLQQQANSIKGGGALKEFTEPHLVIASQAGLLMTAPQSTHIYSGKHIALTSTDHISFTSGGGIYASTREQFSVFVQEDGMRMHAAAGKISMQAQTDNIELIAQKVFDIISTTEWINLKAKVGIRLQAGGSEWVIDATGIFGRTLGDHTIWSKPMSTKAPQGIQQQFPQFSQAICKECMDAAMKAKSPLTVQKQ